MKTVSPAGSSAPDRPHQLPAASRRTHGLILLAIAAVAALVYFPLARANYCGFDDTLELQRLTFHDPGTIANDLHTVLFGTYNKYRPFLGTLNRTALQLGHGSAALFRYRNILAHMSVSMALYGIGLLLFESIPIAAAAALLFAVHPLANQAVTGGSWVISPADFCLFLSFFLFLVSLRLGRWWLAALAAALVIGPLGVLTYDPVILLYGLIPLYLVIWIIIERRIPPAKYWITLGVLTVGFVAGWFALRASVLPGKPSPLTPLKIVVENIFIYSAGVLQLFDPVLATDVFGTPLPKEALSGEVTLGWALLVTLPAFIALMALLFSMKRLRANLTRKDIFLFVFLFLGWAGSLVPYLFFSPHPSETYNYVGIALLLLIAMRLLAAVSTPAGESGKLDMRLFAGVVGVIALLYGAATVDRNLRVKDCGDIVGNILQQLPVGELHQGQWDVVFARVPNEPVSRLYGMYGYKGIDALGVGEYGLPGVAAALQFDARNPEISAEVPPETDFAHMCAAPQPNRLCFWVHASGNLKRVESGAALPPSPESF